MTDLSKIEHINQNKVGCSKFMIRATKIRISGKVATVIDPEMLDDSGLDKAMKTKFCEDYQGIIK